MTAQSRRNVVIPDLLQGQWTAVVIATFGANLTFFETRLVSQLAQVPLRIILADHEQIASTFAEAARTGQRHRLANKAYVAAPIRHPRAAHAKLMLLVGSTAGRLIVGSGNLGYDGYASPGELWHVFAYSDDQTQHVNEFAAARGFIDGLASGGLLDPPVIELLSSAWGGATWLPPSPQQTSVITSNLGSPLIEQLRAAAPGPVRELIAYAPFHDEGSAALRALIRTFTPTRVRLLVTEATSADPAAIKRVLAEHPKAAVELVHVKEEPGTYIHAKWVHLIQRDSETLLTGSANLSPSALLRSSSTGNIEIGLLSSGPPGAFDAVYAPLQRKPVHDVSSLAISYRADEEEEAGEASTSYPQALWSRLDGVTLTIVFSAALAAPTAVELEDYTGNSLKAAKVTIDGTTVKVGLTKDSADIVAEGGRVLVRLDGDDERVSVTWPYHVGHLRSRLDKASQRDRLPRIGDLPEQDAELYELLRELDQTLIIDREAVWRITKPAVARETQEQDDAAIGLEDLDWARVRRDPRYSGYFTRGRAAGLAPTDIQVILAAIGGRLGDIGLDVSSGPADDDEEDLAHEGDTGLSAEAEDADEELEDELTRRRLPISTRTRMAFDRFVRRYAAALGDSVFIEELGPIPAVTNAVIFDHLLSRLLEREAVTPARAIEAHVATWRFLWGMTGSAGLLHGLDADTLEAVRDLLVQAGARATTLRGLASALDYAADDGTAAALRDTARHLITDPEFALDSSLLISAAGGETLATGLLDALAQIAEPISDGEIMDLVVAPYGLARSSALWRTDQVNRRGRGTCQANTFVIAAPVTALTVALAQEVLERVAIAAYYAGHDSTYVRVRFEGNGRSVAFWDDEAEAGVAMVDGDIEDLTLFEPPWPDWSIRVDELQSELDRTRETEQSA